MASRASRRGGLQHRLEAAGLRLLFFCFRRLPLERASAFGGLLLRTLGPWLPAHRIAQRNLARALPELGAAERKRALLGMWDNLGRSVGEFPHLGDLVSDRSRIGVVDPDGVAARLRDDGKGALLLSAHFGNWELGAVAAMRAGLDQVSFYRPANNPLADEVIQELRRPLAPRGLLPKGGQGARAALQLLRDGVHVGMLVDQKENDGIAVPFFGRPAMTTTAPALLAQRLGLPIAVAMVERIEGVRFRIAVSTLEPATGGAQAADVAATMERVNRVFEDHIRRRPDLWLWAHRRWKDDD